MIADPHAVAASWPDGRLRMIAELATAVTTAPWTLSRDHLSRAYRADLSDDDVLHVIALSSFFGHLNRIADATAVPLDYSVRHSPAPLDPSVAAWPTAPTALSGRPAIELSRRSATQTALADWKAYIFLRDAPLTRRQRTVIARWVATWLGDGSISPPADLTANPLDDALRELAQTITLEPWQLTDASYARLREAAFDDAAVFDVCATATSAGVFSRIEVALSALAT